MLAGRAPLKVGLLVRALLGGRLLFDIGGDGCCSALQRCQLCLKLCTFLLQLVALFTLSFLLGEQFSSSPFTFPFAFDLLSQVGDLVTQIIQRLGG